MNPHVREIGGLLACAIGALLMANALFGHGWLVGERDGLEVRGGIINALHCAPADDPYRMPMSVGGHEGCMSEMYARSPLREEAGSWFGGAVHITLFCGAAAAILWLLFCALKGFALEIEVVSPTQTLAMGIFDIQDGAIVLHAHPGVLGTRMAVLAGVALTIGMASAPESLAAGPDVTKFTLGLLLGIGGAIAADPLRFALLGRTVAAAEGPAAEPEAAAAGAETEPLPEQEAAEDDAPSCVKCSGSTLWLEKAGRHRCQKCGLYQPLHPPGSQVDA